MDIDAAKLLTAQIDRVPHFRAGVQGDRIVFEGGRFGPHSLDIGTSTPERVRAHWAGYLSGMSLAVCALLNRQPATIRVGSKVLFPRGMFGEWPGRVVKLYTSRAVDYAQGVHRRRGGEAMAVVAFSRKNGKSGRARVLVSKLVQEAR